MDRAMVEKIIGLRKGLDTDPKQVSYDLYSIEKYVTDFIIDRDYKNPQQVKNLLERQFASLQPEHQPSYSIGKAHTIIEFISLLKKPYDLEEKAKALSDLDKKVLQYIADHKDVTPTDIRKNIEELNDNKQYTSNVLSKLRQSDLITAQHVGKYRWYFLTFIGNEVITHIKKELEQSRKLEQFKQMRVKSRKPEKKRTAFEELLVSAAFANSRFTPMFQKSDRLMSNKSRSIVRRKASAINSLYDLEGGKEFDERIEHVLQ